MSARTLSIGSIWFDADRARQLLDFLESLAQEYNGKPEYELALTTAQAIWLHQAQMENHTCKMNGPKAQTSAKHASAPG